MTTINLVERVRRAISTTVDLDYHGETWPQPVLFLDFGENIVEETEKPTGKTIQTGYVEFSFEYPGIGETLPDPKLGSQTVSGRGHVDYLVDRYVGPRLGQLKGDTLQELLQTICPMLNTQNRNFVLGQRNFEYEGVPDACDYTISSSDGEIAIHVKLRRDGVILNGRIFSGTITLEPRTEQYDLVINGFNRIAKYFNERRQNIQSTPSH